MEPGSFKMKNITVREKRTTRLNLSNRKDSRRYNMVFNRKEDPHLFKTLPTKGVLAEATQTVSTGNNLKWKISIIMRTMVLKMRRVLSSIIRET